MRRAPGSPRLAGLRAGGVLVLLLAVVVVGGTAYGYDRWRTDIEQATASAAPDADRTDQSAWDEDNPTPEATASGTPASEASSEPAPPAVTFAPLEATAGRERPVVLLVGDGYADGRGASSAGTSYPSLLARDLGWDIRLATRTGAGYLSAAPTLLDLFTGAPVDLDPDLVIIQGAYGSNGFNDEAKTAIAALDTAIRAQYADVPVAVVTPFTAEVTTQAETRERTITRAWREDPDVLVLRPQLEGWGAATLDDPGHALIAERMIDTFRAVGLD